LTLIYKENLKHKPGSFGDGPPRWQPDWASACPEDIGTEEARNLLGNSSEGKDPSHPFGKARYALDERGRIFKGYPEDAAGTIWHGYPVADEDVPRQIPARVLRAWREQKRMTQARYKRLIGSAR
jgi:hypothetical protein